MNLVYLDVTDKVKEGLLQFADPLTIIAGVIFFLVLVVAGFVLMMGGANGKENAKTIVICDIVGLIIILLGKEIANMVIGWFGGKQF